MQMAPGELVIRVLLAVLLPPLSVIGLKDVGCGTIILMVILTCFAWVPGGDRRLHPAFPGLQFQVSPPAGSDLT